MKTALSIGQIIISIALIILIVLQNSQESGNNRMSLVQPKFTRRGVEKLTFILTIALLVFFLVSSFLQLIF